MTWFFLYICSELKTKKMLKDFKKFIMTGNVVDLAIAVILAGAVGLVVKGFVSMIMMPIIGMFTGGGSFADMKHVLSEAVVDAELREAALKRAAERRDARREQVRWENREPLKGELDNSIRFFVINYL